MKWYVLFVQTGKELLTKKWLDLIFRDSSCNCIIPKRRIQETKQGKKYDVLKMLFPGYVFIYANMSVNFYYELKKIPHIIKLLGDDIHYSEVPQDHMSLIFSLTGGGEYIDYSTGFVENSKIYILSGPLKGKEGFIRKIDKRKNRATIVFNFMGDLRTIDLGIQLINNLKEFSPVFNS